MPDGAWIVDRQGDEYEMRVNIPSDEHGLFGRQCPACSLIFRIDGDDYEALPDEVELWCVYCGHHAEHSEFVTQQQLDRALRAAGDLGVQIVGQALDDAFGGLSTTRYGSTSGFGIQVSYRSEPVIPEPLPGIDEEKLVRIRQCSGCDLRYAVFGEHRFCPVCGKLPADVVALDAISAETVLLDALAHLPAETAAGLREQGVFTRQWINTIKNMVGIVETLAEAVFHAAVVNAPQRIRGKGNMFQRLDDTADLFTEAGYADLRTVLGPSMWQRLQQTWAARHVFIHNDGAVDDKYLARVPASPARVGQRLTVTEPLCRQAIQATRSLCTALAALTNAAPGSQHGTATQVE